MEIFSAIIYLQGILGVLTVSYLLSKKWKGTKFNKSHLIWISIFSLLSFLWVILSQKKIDLEIIYLAFQTAITLFWFLIILLIIKQQFLMKRN